MKALTAPALLVLGALLGGCGGAAIQVADARPGVAEGAEAAGEAEPGPPVPEDPDADVVVQAEFPPETTPDVQACVTRNDGVLLWTDPANRKLPKMRSWWAQGRQQAHAHLLPQVYARLGLPEFAEQDDQLAHGLYFYELDPMNDRLIFQLDPRIVDLDAFERWAVPAARLAGKAVGVQGAPLGITAQPSCFPAEHLRRLLHALAAEQERARFEYDGSPDLSGRVQVRMVDDTAGRTYAAELRARFGTLVNVSFPSGGAGPGR